MALRRHCDRCGQAGGSAANPVDEWHSGFGDQTKGCDVCVNCVREAPAWELYLLSRHVNKGFAEGPARIKAILASSVPLTQEK